MENWKILDTVAVDKNYDMKGIISGQIVDHQNKMPLSSFEQTKYWFMRRGKLFLFPSEIDPVSQEEQPDCPLKKRLCPLPVGYQVSVK